MLLYASRFLFHVVLQAFDGEGFTPLFNVTGQPTRSLPLAQSGAGLPIGVQCIARYGDEATLFRFAAQLEQALPWASRRPQVMAAQ